MKNIKYFIFLMGIFSLASCNEEFVTKEFTNGIVEDNFYKTVKDAEQALTGVYDPISRKGVYRESFVVLGECSSDNIDEQTGDNGDYGFQWKAVSDYRWLPDNIFIYSPLTILQPQIQINFSRAVFTPNIQSESFIRK